MLRPLEMGSLPSAVDKTFPLPARGLNHLVKASDTRGDKAKVLEIIS